MKIKVLSLNVIVLGCLSCEDIDVKAACERWVNSTNDCVMDYVTALDEEWIEEAALDPNTECAGVDDLAPLETGEVKADLYHCHADLMDRVNCADPEEFASIEVLLFSVCLP